MENYHHGSGVIKFDPYRAGMKRRTDYWSIVQVDREITRYYRWWLKREKHIHLDQPSWDAHISLVRGEKSASKVWDEFKQRYDGQKIDFLYEHGNYRCHPDGNLGGFFYWVDVECPQLDRIRKEMNLPRGFRFHITVGRTYY